MLFLLLEALAAQTCSSSITYNTSLEATQLATNSLVFIISAPGNCLQTIADLPKSPNKNMAALWIRAAFHSAGTWQPQNSSLPGGAEGSIMSFLDNNEENMGLSDSISPKFQQNPSIKMSNADLVALAGQITVTHCGGPQMDFYPGRIDTEGIKISPVGRVPPGDSTLASFRPRAAEMEWTNEDIVALVSGSHTMGYD